MTTILIWNNNMIGRGHHTTGHASMNIDDYWGQPLPEIIELVPTQGPALPPTLAAPLGTRPAPVAVMKQAPPPMDRVEYPGSYVSWWPQNNVAGPRLRSVKPSFYRDLRVEIYAPDHILRLTGMNEANMKTEWTRIRTKENAHYKLYGKNCSTIVARVMRAGTTWRERNLWRAHSEMWTPLKVKRFAFNLGAKEIEWGDFCAEMRRSDCFPDIADGNSTRRRSNAHGNPNTPARFVDGVDTAPRRR
jgi:hypothetical protein